MADNKPGVWQDLIAQSRACLMTPGKRVTSYHFSRLHNKKTGYFLVEMIPKSQHLRIMVVGLILAACSHSNKADRYALSRQDTTTVLQTVINDWNSRWENGFRGQHMRILPNRYIQPGTAIQINGRGAQPPVDSTYWVKLSSEQETILKKYVQENKSFGLSKHNTVLLVRISTPYGNPDAYELLIGATNREDIFLRDEPAYGSEIDGYPVALFIGWDLSSIIQFPKNHSDFIKKYFLSKVEKKPKPKVIYSRRNAKGEILPIPKLIDERPLEGYENWRVALKKGEKPIIKKLL